MNDIDATPQRSRSSLRRTSAPLWGAEAAIALAGVITVIVTARLLGAEKYGITALAMAAPQLVYSILEARSGHASVKFVARFRSSGQLDRARGVIQLGYVVDGGIALITFAITAALAPFLSRAVLDDAHLIGLLVGYGAVMMLRAPTSASIDALTSVSRFSLLAVLRTAGAIVRMVATITFVAISPTVESMLAGFALGMAIESGVLLFAAVRFVGHDLDGSMVRSTIGSLRGQRREIVTFVALSDASSLLRVLATQSDVLILGFVSGTSEVGVYRLARQLVVPAMSLITPVQSVLLPRLSETFETKGFEASRDEASSASRRIGQLLALCFFSAIPLTPFLMRTIGGGEYSDAARPAQFMLALAGFWALALWVQPLLIAAGRMKDILAMMTIALIVTVTGYVVLGLRFGGSGVAASRLIGIGGVVHLGGLLHARRIRGAPPASVATASDDGVAGSD